jgi:hypothetical protein
MNGTFMNRVFRTWCRARSEKEIGEKGERREGDKERGEKEIEQEGREERRR